LSDLPTIFAWRNHISVRQFMFTQHEISLTEHEAWFHEANQDNTSRLMVVEEKKQPIGYVQFSKVSIDGVADWGFYTAPNSPKGTGRRLGVTALSYAFNVLRLHKVCGQALEKNNVSICFHQNLGFKQEGVLREQQFIDGIHHNIHCFGLIAREWALIKANLE